MTPLGYIKLAGLALLLVLLGYVGLTVRGWHQDSLRVEAIETELSTLKAAQEASQKASEDYQSELKALRSRSKPNKSVRVCRNADKLPETQPGHNGSTPGTGELPQTAGRDIGPDLYGLADEADELAARLRACQALLK